MIFSNVLTLLPLLAMCTARGNRTNEEIPSSCIISSGTTATSQADLDQFADCDVISGDLEISGVLASAALANVRCINGSLIINNATLLNTFSADTLEEITDTLRMQSLTVLSSASFGSLRAVDTINLITLPAFTTFSTNLQSANNILVSDTGLENVDGFSTLQTVNVLNINNNRFLNSFSSNVRNITDSLQISFNGRNANLEFDNLQWANNITLRDVDDASFGSLIKVNESLGFINNTFPALDLSLLEEVGQTLSIISNNELTDADFLNLTTIGGGFVISNNTNYQIIDGFSNVETVGGAIDITGDFSVLDLSSLSSVRGGATFDTTSSNFSCEPFEDLQSDQVIQGDSFVCKNGATSTSSSASRTSTSSSSATSSSASSSSASEDFGVKTGISSLESFLYFVLTALL